MHDTSRVLILYTGGTIGMHDGPRGFVPAPGFLAQQLANRPQFHDPAFERFTTAPSRYGRRVRFDIKEYDPLLDSSNMSVEDWVRIASDIEAHYDAYDAFVVLHGTDTMAYTASALSFMLENLGKTVILTGSQIPLSQLRNDAIDNLLGALIIAGHYEIPEVTLYFRNKLLRGNRAQKVDASGFDAFESGNCPPLARVGTDIVVDWDEVRPPPDRPLRVRPITNRNVAALRLFPGITHDIITNFLRPPLEGLVIETYGAGNAPDRRQDFLDAIRAGTDRGVLVVNTTQCHRGMVTTEYAAGAALAEVGVVGGYDMTPEAALTKLSYLLSQPRLSRARVAELMRTDLRGELTEPAAEVDGGASARFSLRARAFVTRIARALAASTAAARDVAAIERALYPVLLCSAAAVGDAAGIDRLVAAGADVNAADYDGRTALHLAASEGRLATIEQLLAHGADPAAVDRWGNTPLADAERYGHTALVARLREAAAASLVKGR